MEKTKVDYYDNRGYIGIYKYRNATKTNLRCIILKLLYIQLIITNIIWIPNIIYRIMGLVYIALGIIALVTGNLKPRTTFFTKLIYTYCFFLFISGLVGGYFSLELVLSTVQFVCFTIIICCFSYEELIKQMSKYLKTISMIIPYSVIYSIFLVVFGKIVYKDGIYENYINSFFLQKAYGYYGDLGYASFYTNSNIWALLIFLSIVYYLYIYNGKKKFFYIAIASVGIILSDSRAIEICCIIMFVLKGIEWLKNKIEKRGRLVLFILECLCILAIIGRELTNIADKIQNIDWAGRIQMWIVMLQSIKKHPIFGIGFSMSTKKLLGDTVLGTTVGSHNSYLNVIAENGIVGGIILIVMIIFILGIIKKVSITSLNDTNCCYCAVRTIFLIYIIYSFVENALMIVEFRHVIWLMSCLIIEGFYIKKKNNGGTINQYFSLSKSLE